MVRPRQCSETVPSPVLPRPRLPFVAINRETVLAAVAGSQEHTLSFWNALIVETARVGGFDVVLTEDMQDGREFGAVTIRSPFRPAQGK